MAILQLPKQQRHPDVEEFIFSHFNVPTFTVIDERYRSYRVNMAGVEDDQVIDLALICIKSGGFIGYQLNSIMALISGEFVADGEVWGLFPFEVCEQIADNTGFTKVFQLWDNRFQDKFYLYWRPQKKDPFEWLHEKGFHVLTT